MFHKILSNDGLVAFHYRSYGTFFLQQNRLHNSYGGFTHYRNYRAAFLALGGLAIIYMIFGLALFLPWLALTVRRLRDAGFHWALIFVGFIPMVGGIALLVLLAMPSKEVEVVILNKAEEVVEVSPFEEPDNK